MANEMGTFRVDVEIENPAEPGERRLVPSVLVDTGAELSWFPAAVLESLGITRRKSWRFRRADGRVLSRWSGPAYLYVSKTTATDDVVFGEPSDLVLLGSRSLEGLNLRVDPTAKRLIDAGPAPAAPVQSRAPMSRGRDARSDGGAAPGAQQPSTIVSTRG
jgi:predicted aspartyl protease